MSGSKKRPALDEDDDAVTQDVESSLSDIAGRVLSASVVNNSARQDHHEPGRVIICVDILEGDKIEIRASTAGYEIIQHRAVDGTVRPRYVFDENGMWPSFVDTEKVCCVTPRLRQE
jgi:hypothetical protein